MDTRSRGPLRLVAAVALGLALLAGTARAGTLTFEYADVFGGTAPIGERPWLTATIASTWLFKLDRDLDRRWLRIEPLAGLDWDRFDLEIDFPHSHRWDRFDDGDVAEFLILWLERAHVQGIGWCGDDRGRVPEQPTPQPPGEPVPEPCTLLLVGSGVLGLGSLRRRRHRG